MLIVLFGGGTGDFLKINKFFISLIEKNLIYLIGFGKENEGINLYHTQS
jgi:hypothetical protein